MSNLKTFSEHFDPERVNEYAKFILAKFDDYLIYRDIVDKMERSSNEFQNLTNYHRVALSENDKYNQLYQHAVETVEIQSTEAVRDYE